MKSCCLHVCQNRQQRNFNLCDFQAQGYARILYVIRDLHKECGFISPVCFLYRLSRFPIHEYLFILCIAYLSLCIFYKGLGVAWNITGVKLMFVTGVTYIPTWRTRKMVNQNILVFFLSVVFISKSIRYDYRWEYQTLECIHKNDETLVRPLKW